jgi:hypothetical protein
MPEGFGRTICIDVERYYPIFVGKTKDNKKIVVYFKNDTFHILRPDGELCALEPGAEIETWVALETHKYHARIVSEAWTGDATGTRKDLIEEPSLLHPLPEKDTD